MHSCESLLQASPPLLVDANEASCLSGSLPSESPTHFAPVLLMTLSVLSLACYLRTDRLLTVSFWFDEACAWRISQFPIREMNDAIARDAHPPLYFYVQKGWQLLFGPSTPAARSLSLIAGLCGVALTALLAWRVSLETIRPQTTVRPRARASRVAILAATLVAMNAMQVELSQTARPYMFGVCLTLLSSWFCLRMVAVPEDWRYGCGFAVSSVALSFTHYFGLGTVLGLWLFAIIETVLATVNSKENSRPRERLTGLLLCVGFWQCCWWPWQATFESQRLRANSQLWMPPLTFEKLTETLWRTIAGVQSGLIWPDWTVPAAAVWFLVPVILCVKFGRGGRLLGLSILTPLVLSISYSVLERNLLGPRYLIFAQVELLIGIALIVASLNNHVLRRLGYLFLLGWSGYWAWEHSQQRSWYANHAGILQSMDYLNRVRQAGEPVIVSTPFLYPSMLQHLEDRENVFVIYHGDHRLDLLAGPPLRDADYQSVSRLFTQSTPTVWTVDVEDLFDQVHEVPVPQHYHPTQQVRFTESFGVSMAVLVRCYVSSISSGTNQRRIIPRNL